MEADTKIYIVITVLAVIMAGLFIYLYTIDRKIGKLEKEEKKETNLPEE
jgi:hypothetical protein